MKAKNRMTLFGIFIIILMTLSNTNIFAATITFDGSTDTKWNTAANWDLDRVPISTDDVIIPTALTVSVDVSPTINSLTLNGSAVLEPDASSSRVMTIELDLAINGTSRIYYNNNSGTGTGRLAWVFNGAGGTNTITNNAAASTSLQFGDLTIAGNIATAAGLGSFYVYGDFITTGGNFTAAAGDGVIFMTANASGDAQAITNPNTVTFDDFTITGSSTVVTSNAELNVLGSFTVATGASLALSTPSIILMDTDGETFNPTGTTTFGTGTTLRIRGNINITQSMTGFAGTLQVDASEELTVTATKDITGTGLITTGAASKLIIEDGDGVAGVFALSGSNSIDVDTDYQIINGSLGFSGLSISTISDLEIGSTSTTDQTVTATETFTMSGNFTMIDDASDGNSFVSNSGTITMSGAGAIITTNSESVDFYGLTVTGVGVTTVADESFIVNNWLSTSGSGTLLLTNSTADNNTITFDGTATVYDVTGSSIDFNNDNNFYITGSLTLASNLAADGATSGGTEGLSVAAAGTLDFAGFTFTGTNNAVVTTASGATLKSAHAAGISGNITTAVASVINAGTSYEFNSGAVQCGFEDFDGQTTSITVIDDLVINGAAIVNLDLGTPLALQVNGDITVTTGSMILTSTTEIITMATTQNCAITNSTGTATNLTFRGLVINGAFTATTSGDFYLAANTNVLDFATGAGTLDATTNSSHIYISGAGNIDNTVTSGTANFYHLTVVGAVAVTLDATFTANFNITGNLTLDNAGGSFTGATLSQVAFSGSAAQVIETTGGTLSLDLITISNSAGVTANDNMTWSSAAGAVIVSGQFVASAGTVTFGATTATMTNSGNSSTFFNVAAGTALTSTGNWSIINDLTGTALTVSANTLTFLGDPADLDSNVPLIGTSTGDSKQIATAATTTLTVTGTLVVDSNCELQRSLIIAGAGTITVNGRLELGATAAKFGAGTLDFSNGELHLSGTNLTDLADAAGTVTGGSSANAILDGTQATVTSAAFTLNNLILSSSAEILMEAGTDLTIYGSVENEGTAMTNSSDDGSLITLAGATPAITGTSAIAVGTLTVNAASGTAAATCDASTLIILNAAVANFNVTSGDSFTASAGTVQFDDDDGATTGYEIVNSNTDGTGLTFYDLDLLATATGISYNSGITVANDFTTNTNATMTSGTSGTITFSGTGTTLAIGTLNAVGDFSFHDVVISGSVNVDHTTATDLLLVTGDFYVTSIGAFTMTDGGIDFDETGTDNQTISNSGSLQIADLVISQASNADTVKVSDDYSVSGLVLNTAGTLMNEGNIVTFTGTTETITSSGLNDELSFYSISVSGAYTLVSGDQVQIKGNIAVSSGGTLAGADATSVFQMDSTGNKTISNAGTLTFGDLVIGDDTDNVVTTTSDFTLIGDLIVGGTTNSGESFTATAGTITGGALSDFDNATGTAADLTMFNLTIPTGTAATTSATKELYINGDLTIAGTGTFLPGNTSKLWFGGSAEQTISIGSGSPAFSPVNMTLNNSNGLRLLSTNTNIAEDDFDVEGILRLQSGDLDLNGNNIITFDYDTYTATNLNETSGNTVINSGLSTSTGHLVAKRTYVGTASNDNLAGFGARITALVNPGLVTIKRYNTERTIGGDVQVSRYYGITSANGSLDGKLVVGYDDSELGATVENDLILMRTTDETNGPWYKQVATLDATLNRLTTESNTITQFTGEYEFWTIGTPTVLTATEITSNLADNPLASGSSENTIFGVQFTSNGSMEITDVRFNLGRALGATVDFSDFEIFYSADNDASTTGDNTSLLSGTNATTGISGGTTGDSYVEFDLDGASVSSAYTTVSQGSPVNYFLRVDPVVSLTASTSTITPSIGEGQLTVTNGIIDPFSITGTNYSFLPSIQVSESYIGVSQGPLVIGEDDNAIFGFKAVLTSTTGLPGFTGFTLKFDNDPSAVFDNVRLFVSTDADYETSGDNTEITLTTETIGTSSIDFGFTEQKLNGTATPKYYFITADVRPNINQSVSDITPRMVFNDITSTNAGIRGTDISGNALDSISGFTYDFFNSRITVDTDENPSASDLGRNFAKQPIFNFTLTPDDGQSIEFTKVIVHVELSSENFVDFSNWELFNDANLDGFGVTSERISIGVLDSTATKGNLTFTLLATETISSATNYIISVKPKSIATVGGTIGVYIPDENYIFVNSPSAINAGGPFPATSVKHTIRNNGTATKLAFLPGYDSTVVSGSTLSFVCRAIDANGYPTIVSSATNLTLTKVSGTGTIGGTATGTIANGENAVAIAPTFTVATTDLLMNIVDGAGSPLTSSDNSSSITIYDAAPTTNDGTITFGTETSVSIPITNISAASTPGSRRIVVLRQGFTPADPVNGIDYTANVDISAAGDVGTGQTEAGSYVIYDGTSNGAISLTILGLVPDTRYFFKIFEYNGTGSTTSYITSSAFTSETSKNPTSTKTTTGSFSSISDSTTAANIPTDVDVTSTISDSTDVDFFKFRVPSSKSNILIRISDLTADCTVELYDNSGNDPSTMSLLRSSAVTGTTDEVLILNGLSNGPYMLRVYAADRDGFSTATYTLRISTSANEVMSVTN